MTDSDLRQLADAASQVLRPHLEKSETLRRAVALIGKWLCEEAGQPTVAIETRVEPIAPAPSTTSVAPELPVSEEANAVMPVAVAEHSPVTTTPSRPSLSMSSALVPLKLGDAVVHLPLSGTTEEIGRARQAAVEPKMLLVGTPIFSERAEVDLALVERRCRLKAASCRLFIEKRAADADSDSAFEARRRLDEMLAQVKAMPSCFLWVFWRERVQPEDAALYQIADNYDAHADAVGLMRRIDESDGGILTDDEIDAFHLLAESNSALRIALALTWLTDDDRDQAEVHIWLRQETSSRRVFIERHMTADDPADPSKAADIRERIKQTSRRLDDRAIRAKGIKNALGQIRYHAGQVVKRGLGDSSEHWAKIADGVAKLASMGVLASNRRIAEHLGPDAAALWPSGEADTRGLSAVVARAVALAPSSTDAGDESSEGGREWSKSVLDVRTLLRGKRLVVIGGERNGDAVERLVQAFELTDAKWVPLTEHGPSTKMRAPIFRPDTAAVVVIVKLTGHLHADEAKEFAKAAGKPCVLLSGGYNPERVAKAILDQASTRLGR